MLTIHPARSINSGNVLLIIHNIRTTSDVMKLFKLWNHLHLRGCDIWMLQTSTACFRTISTWMRMFSERITFPFLPPPPWLSSGVCCAVSVDLWYRSQDPPLTAHLYLYCRDTAHSGRKREAVPCGDDRQERERARERRAWLNITANSS